MAVKKRKERRSRLTKKAIKISFCKHNAMQFESNNCAIIKIVISIKIFHIVTRKNFLIKYFQLFQYYEIRTQNKHSIISNGL